MTSEQESERDPALLTKGQRGALRGYVDDRGKRREIRDRITDGLLDFSYLMGNVAEDNPEDDPNLGLQSRDINQIFDPDEDDRAQFDEALADAIAFIYLGSVGRVPKFETILKRGVRRAEQRLAENEALLVDVDYNVQRDTASQLDWDAITEHVRREEWDALSEEELRTYLKFYVNSGEFDPDRPIGHFEQQIEAFKRQAADAKRTRAKNIRETQQAKEKYGENDRRG